MLYTYTQYNYLSQILNEITIVPSLVTLGFMLAVTNELSHYHKQLLDSLKTKEDHEKTIQELMEIIASVSTLMNELLAVSGLVFIEFASVSLIFFVVIIMCFH